MSNLSELLRCDDFTEAYAVGALFIAKEFLAARNTGETLVVEDLNPDN